MKPRVATGVVHQLQRNQDNQKHYYDKGLKAQDQVRMHQGKQWIPAMVTATALTPRWTNLSLKQKTSENR